MSKGRLWINRVSREEAGIQPKLLIIVPFPPDNMNSEFDWKFRQKLTLIMPYRTHIACFMLKCTVCLQYPSRYSTYTKVIIRWSPYNTGYIGCCIRIRYLPSQRTFRITMRTVDTRQVDTCAGAEQSGLSFK